LAAGALAKGGSRSDAAAFDRALDGAVSRIVSAHDAESIVTIPRFFADTVVTKYGIARQWGKKHRRRAQELIAVAHPDFRVELRREAEGL
jgi:4-hydroxybutyrate CoA-transferase